MVRGGLSQLLLLIAVAALAVACSSAPATSTPTPTPEGPAVPEGFHIRKVSSGAISSLAWDDRYEPDVSIGVQRRFGDVPHWADLAIVPAYPSHYETSPSAAIAPWNSITYCFRARAVGLTAISDWTAETCDSMGAGEPHPPPIWPPAPRGFTVERLSEGGISLAWEVAEVGQFGPVYSQVLRRSSDSGDYEAATGLLLATEFVDPAGGPGHCYRIVTAFADRGRSAGPDVCVQ